MVRVGATIEATVVGASVVGAKSVQTPVGVGAELLVVAVV